MPRRAGQCGQRGCNTWEEMRRLAWHRTCKVRGKRHTAVQNIRQESHGDMATHAPVLIIDGNPQMTALLQRFLARQRVDAQGVLSPAEAHSVLAQQAFGVVLTDAFLPSGDGLALLRALR